MIEKGAPLGHQLSWSHYRELLPIKDINEIKYYINLCETLKLTRDQLKFKIKSNEYKRLDESTKIKLINEDKSSVDDFVKNPILIKNSNNYDVISEKVLQKLILEDIESFMQELGNSFCFVGSEYKIKIGDRYNYIDLLLFNYSYNCFVVIELKITELRKEHIGQIQFYMNYVDKNIKNINQDKTVGIIICKTENKFIMEYCSDNRIFETTYKLEI